MRDEKKVESGNDKCPQILFTFLESQKILRIMAIRIFQNLENMQIPKPHLAMESAPKKDTGLTQNLSNLR